MRRPYLLSSLILLSALITFIRSGPLHGSLIALLLAVLFQVYLPGYVLARFLDRHRIAHPILRFAWILACGLSLTIVLGGIARLFNLPVYVYLLLLHALLLLLTWAARRHDAPQIPWSWSWSKLPLYGLLALSCLTVMVVSYSNRYRFHGFEDQVIFIGNINWLAHNPGEQPLDKPLRTRQIGRIPTDSDTRHDSDGWTYNHAAWVWASGYRASELIWYDLDPLFLWTVPLVTFAAAYTLTRREDAAAWSAAALTIAGLMTLDNIVHGPNYSAYGRFAVFQINTLRQMSITLMLPLVLLLLFSYLRTYRWRDLALLILAGIALAMLHPIQIMIFILSLVVTAAFKWLAKPNWRRLRRLLPLLPAVLIFLALPFIQRLNRVGLDTADSIIDAQAAESAATVSVRGGVLLLPDLPVLGDTFIRSPASVFYHPVILLTVLLGLLYVLRLRRSLAAQYIFGTTALLLLIFFTPGLTELYNKFASSVGLLTTIFLLPLALILGLSLDYLLRRLGRGSVFRWPASLLLLLLIALLLFEPLPIPVSAHDQLRDYNAMQEERRWLAAHEALAAALPSLIPPEALSIVMAPSDLVNIAVEELPHTLITGGRGSGNLARFGDNRFFHNLDSSAPWLDSEDLAYLQHYGVTHIISRRDHSRLPQMLLQSERFSLLGQTDETLIFAVTGDTVADPIDALYARMNAQFDQLQEPRWSPAEGFILLRPGAANAWEPLAAEWESMLAQSPQEDRARLGLAYAYMMMGADEQALPLWSQLHNIYPQIPYFADALAYTQHIVGDAQSGADVLLSALDNDSAAVRTLAARSLLTEHFFHMLGPEDLDRLLSLRESDASAWEYLIFFSAPERIRNQAALWMSATRWAAALQWLDELPEIEISPRDVTAQAANLLAQGDAPGALARLAPATDLDWRAAKVFWHPDRWQNNQAARMFSLLRGDLALRDGRIQEAVSAYEQAVAEAALIPGQYFLAQALEQSERAAQIHAGLPADLSLLPLLSIADTRNPFVMLPQVTQNETAGELRVSAVYGAFLPYNTFPIRFWRFEIIAPDGSTRYLAEDIRAQLQEDALVAVAVTLSLPETDPLTPALLVISPAHNNAVTMPPAIVPLVLNRPDEAMIPVEALPTNLRFGESIQLDAYQLEVEPGQITLDLYWQAAETLPEDYQVFVHVLDADGEIILQDDRAPAQGRYPSSQWRANTTILDRHVFAAEALPADFEIRLGLYRLTDQTRLPITPVDERIQDNSLRLYSPAASR